MTPSNFYEIFNHFVSSKDVTQMLGLSDKVEVFSSKTFGTGELTHGEVAPNKFRNAVTSYAKSKKKPTMKMIAMSSTPSGSIYCVEFNNKRSKHTSAISVIFRQNNLVGFVEN